MRTLHGCGIALAILTGVGCGDDDGSTMGTDSGTTTMTDAGPERATFTEVYTIISANCSPCHIGGTSGMLDMSTQANAYANLVGVAAMGFPCGGEGTRVVPGDPDTSILYSKVAEDTPVCGGRMPQGPTALDASDIETIRSWIAAGALDD